MSDSSREEKEMSDSDRDDDEGDAVSLLRLSGPRPSPSAERTAAAHAYVRAAWRAGVRLQRARAAFLLAAAGLAAAVVVAIVGRWSAPQAQNAPLASSAPVEAVAVLDAAAGPVERGGPAGWTRLAVGEILIAGSRVRAGAGGAGLRTGDGRSVRLAARSRIRWGAPETLTLEAGAVYVDSGGRGSAGAPFEVVTAWGAVRETGTQFEVRLEAEALRVRVREGRVAVAGEDAASGTELRVDARGATRRVVPVHGPEWSWVLALAPGFEMDGRTLHELLGWAARETGWELRYVDAASQRRSQQAELRGSIRGLRPDEAAVAVIASTGLPHELGGGVLRIGPVPEAAGH